MNTRVRLCDDACEGTLAQALGGGLGFRSRLGFSVRAWKPTVEVRQRAGWGSGIIARLRCSTRAWKRAFERLHIKGSGFRVAAWDPPVEASAARGRDLGWQPGSRLLEPLRRGVGVEGGSLGAAC
eukprot:366296-Chlamydomonas_euryale.AAC.8